MSLNPQESHLKRMAATQPSMRRGEGEPLAQWQKKARAKLAALLGLPLEGAAAHYRLLETQEKENGVSAYRFVFSSEPDVEVNCQLLLPERAKREKVPLVICLQGHSKGMHISLGEPK